jgi:hypothetical protein
VQSIHTREDRLGTLAAKLMAVAIQHAQQASDPAEVANAAKLHDEGKLYPELTIRMPHGGKGIRLDLTLRDPETNTVIVRMLEIEGQAAEVLWN